MNNNDIDYSRPTNKAPGLVQELALMDYAKSGIARDLNATQQRNQEISREAERISREKERISREKQQISREKEKLQVNLVEEQNKAEEFQNKASILEFEVGDLANTVSILRNEILRLNELLNQPLEEIAKQHTGFAKNYEKQMELMAKWMVSQKAYKELAIGLGSKNELSVEDVIRMGKDKEIDVLDSKNLESNNTNANNSSIIRPRVKKLKEEYCKSRRFVSKEQSLENIKTIQEKNTQSTEKNKLTI